MQPGEPTIEEEVELIGNIYVPAAAIGIARIPSIEARVGNLERPEMLSHAVLLVAPMLSLRYCNLHDQIVVST